MTTDRTRYSDRDEEYEEYERMFEDDDESFKKMRRTVPNKDEMRKRELHDRRSEERM